MGTKNLLSEELPQTESWMCCVTGSPNTRRYTSSFSLFLSIFLCLCRRKNKTKQHFCNDSAVVPQDFELNTELKMRVIGFLEEVMHDPELLTQERKAAANIIRLVFRYRRWIVHAVIYDTSVCQHPEEKTKQNIFLITTISHSNIKLDNLRYSTSTQVLA